MLEGDEAHHLSRVLRIKAGQLVRLFDGQGRHGVFTIAKLEKNRVLLEMQSQVVEQAPKTLCTLALGFSKALRRSWFLEKAVELGAHSLWFWQGEFSQAKLPDGEKNSWKASLIAGAKQCENAWLPDLQMVTGGVASLVAQKNNFDRVIVLYEGDTSGRLLKKEDLTGVGEIMLVIGPEGGFSPAEVACLQDAGIEMVSMGDSILRWETAAVLALGMAWWARQ